MTEIRLEGGCLCGEVRYSAVADPFSVSHCHCRMCQQSVGAAVVTWATFRSGEITFNGRLTYHRSSDKARRGFCRDCGTSLTFAHKDWPDEVDITAASLDTPEKVQPLDHIHTGSRISWMKCTDGLPEYPGSRPGTGGGF